MRLLCILAVSLVASTASADSPRTLPFEIVTVLPTTKQVLVYDKAHNTHVLLEPGSKFDDLVVVAIGGIGVTMQRDQDQFTVYPRAAMGLALQLDKTQDRLPAVFSKDEPAVVPVRVAKLPAVIEAKKRIAIELASLLATD